MPGASTARTRARARAKLAQLRRRELEHIADQQIRMVFWIIVETRRGGTRKHEPSSLLAEQAGWHGGPGTHHRGVQHPAPRPARLETLLRYRKIRSGGAGVVLGVSRSMTLQTGRA